MKLTQKTKGCEEKPNPLVNFGGAGRYMVATV
jgi:hypothetical protein